MSERKYKYDERTLKDFLKDSRKFSLVLPHFQRDFVWDKEKQKSLLQSMLAGIPIGSILLLEDTKKSYASRPLCFREFEPKIEGDKCTFLLDGQQRISTLKSMFCDLFSETEIEKLQKDSWQDLWEDLPSKLRYRWCLKIDLDSEDENDIWGIKNLDFKETHENDKSFSPTDFQEYIVCERVHKTKKTPYHPNSSKEDLVKWAISEKLVPLYLLGTNPYLLKKILTHIADHKYFVEQENEENEENKEKIEMWVSKVTTFLEDMTLKTGISSIILEGQTGMEVGIYIFEQVNRGGVQLDIYDLLVARMALCHKDTNKNVNLTKKIEQLCKDTQSINEKIYHGEKDGFDPRNMDIWNKEDNIPQKIFKKVFKNCLAICNLKNTYGLRDHLSDKYIKENHLLKLTDEEIYDNYEETVLTLFSVLQFLHFRCGVVKLEDIPYELLVVPLFVFFIENENKPTKEDVDKIEFWYWASIFCGRYREKQSTRVIKDSNTIIENKDFHEKFHDRFDTIFQAIGYSDKESLIRTREYSRQPQLDKAITQYVLSQEPWDLRTNRDRYQLSAYYFAKEDINLEKNIHHIIPLNEIAKQEGMETKKLRENKEHPVNSMLNKVIISQKANWQILRVNDYKDNQNQLNCDKNMIPVPTERKFINPDKSYNLNRFLEVRFEMIKQKVKDELQILTTKPPTKE